MCSISASVNLRVWDNSVVFVLLLMIDAVSALLSLMWGEGVEGEGRGKTGTVKTVVVFGGEKTSQTRVEMIDFQGQTDYA